MIPSYDDENKAYVSEPWEHADEATLAWARNVIFDPRGPYEEEAAQRKADIEREIAEYVADGEPGSWADRAGDRLLALVGFPKVEELEEMYAAPTVEEPQQLSAADGSASEALAQLRATFREHLLLPDPAVVDFTVAVAVANRLGGDPVWAFLVAAPSNGKTETLQSMYDLPEVHPLSTLTPNTLLSGAKDGAFGRSASLLLRLPDPALLVLKDFGSILSMREDARAEILGQLREVYDGSAVKETGTGRTIVWSGKVGFLAGVTPAIDAHHAVIAVLGERFLYFRMPVVDAGGLGRRALVSPDDDAMRMALRNAVTEFVLGLDMTRPDFTPEVIDRLVNIASLVTWARSAVQRDRFTRDIEVAPTPEAPGRFVKQLGSLWRALTIMGHEDPLGLVCRVALDSMPPARSAALAAIVGRGIVSTTAVRDVTRLSSTANRRLLEDLEALDLIQIVDRGSAGVAGTWQMSEKGLVTWETGLGNLHPQYQGGVEQRNNKAVDVPGGEVAGASPWAEYANAIEAVES